MKEPYMGTDEALLVTEIKARNARLRLRRNLFLCAEALESFDSKNGHRYLDLREYEKQAERAQMNALDVAQAEAQVKFLKSRMPDAR